LLCASHSSGVEPSLIPCLRLFQVPIGRARCPQGWLRFDAGVPGRASAPEETLALCRKLDLAVTRPRDDAHGAVIRFGSGTSSRQRGSDLNVLSVSWVSTRCGSILMHLLKPAAASAVEAAPRSAAARAYRRGLVQLAMAIVVHVRSWQPPNADEPTADTDPDADEQPASNMADVQGRPHDRVRRPDRYSRVAVAPPARRSDSPATIRFTSRH
jgi:hypothetical protein